MKKINIFTVIPVFVLIVLITISSCSGESGQSSGKLLSVNSDMNKIKTIDIVADIEAYTPPSDVDTNLFETLSKKLIEDFEAYRTGRLTSAEPIETHTIYGSYIDNGNGSYTFVWDYYNLGDYDLSGEVAVPDITPIANNYLASTSDGTNDRVESFIDGDSSGEIGISDITPIATNYLTSYSTVSGFFITQPANTLTAEEFIANAMFGIHAGFTPQGVDRVFILDEDFESETYGQLSLTFQSDQIPTSAGEYIYVIRDENDPPRFLASIPFIVGNPVTTRCLGSITLTRWCGS